MTDEQVKHLVNRFLVWRLPASFNPDGGVSFKAEYNENTPFPMKHEPTGTNLLDAPQAEAMVRFMLGGLQIVNEKEVSMFKEGDRVSPIDKVLKSQRHWSEEQGYEVVLQEGQLGVIDGDGDFRNISVDGCATNFSFEDFKLVSRADLVDPLDYLKITIRDRRALDAASMLRACYGLEVRQIPASVEFVPVE